MPTIPRLWPLLLIVPFAASCLPVHNVCLFDAESRLAFDLPPDQCPRNADDTPRPCYRDRDLDGFGEAATAVFLLEEAQTCGDPARPFQLYRGDPVAPELCEWEVPYPDPDCYRLTTHGGDCDDTDSMAFPGNPEVCDGVDNDCSGGPDFDTDHEELAKEDGADGAHLFTCTPVPTIRVFLRGGGHLGQRALDGTSLEVAVAPGEVIQPVLRLRFLVPRGQEPHVSGGVARSWVPNPAEAWLSFDEFEVDFDSLTPSSDGREDRFIDLDVTTPDKVAIPQDAFEGETHYLTMVGAIPVRDEEDGPGELEVLGNNHVGSLTSPNYCYGDGICPPVWVIPFPDDPQDPQSETYDIDLNVADLEDLELAACRPFGTANMPVLFDAVPLEPNAPPRCDFTLGDQCIPITWEFPLGCNFAKFVVTDNAPGAEE